jgi:hypothetical protein
MTGQTVFDRMMNEVINSPARPSFAPIVKITQEQFDEWQKQASFDIMKGLRYGQSFCNHFGITDNILYYEFSWLNAEEYIRRAYIDSTK